jgi:Glycosyl transferase family 2
MRLYTLNCYSLASQSFEAESVLISITDPGKEHPVPPASPKLRAVLRLSFFDIEEPMPKLRCMSAQDADRVWAFVQEWRHRVEHFYIQCDIGVGRSVGLASALTRIYKGSSLMCVSAKPNRFVEGQVLDAARRAGLANVPLHQPDKVSICVRVKYPVDRLTAMLLCLQRQTYKNWEALIVTDGPDPETRHALERVVDPRVILLETPEAKGRWGHPYRNLSIQRCTGAYIGLTNDDNYYVPGYIDQMVGALKMHNADLALCQIVHAYSGWCTISTTQPRAGACDLGNWIVKAAIAKSTPWPGEDFLDDGRYVEALAAKGKTVVVPRALFVKN